MSASASKQQVETLKEQIRDVRNRVVGIVVHMDDIRLQQLPQIRADYALKIGCWEQALLEAELAARRARRRLALVQAYINRGETPQMEEVEQTLDDELATWMVKAEQARMAYERALSYVTGMRVMTKSESGELKRLYHKLVKRLHPDVCHSSEDHRAGLFQIAQAAYANGDVQALRSLEVATRHLDPANDDLTEVDDAEMLAQELELARIEEGVMTERLQQLEDCEEMRLGALLADPEWVTKRTTELRRAVKEWERMREECDDRLRELKESIDEH